MAVVQVGTVAGDILGHQDELLDPGAGQLPRLRQQGLHGPAAVTAPQGRDDTEGTAIVAALRNLQEGGIGGRGDQPGPILHRPVDVPKELGGLPRHGRLGRRDNVGIAAGSSVRTSS